MSKRNFERKLTSYSNQRKEGLCVNTHTPKEGERLPVGQPLFRFVSLVPWEAHGFEQFEKLQHRMLELGFHYRGRLSNFLCYFKTGHPRKECEFNHSVMQWRDCIQDCVNESPLFCDVDRGG